MINLELRAGKDLLGQVTFPTKHLVEVVAKGRILVAPIE